MQKLVRYITVAYLITLILIKMLALPFLCLQFDLNRADIATRLCENKNKPEMQCAGKCQLKKQLNATENMNNSASQHATTFPVSVDFFQEFNDLSLSKKIPTPTTFSNHPISTINDGFETTVFHPPGYC